jgi:hypothetical protein
MAKSSAGDSMLPEDSADQAIDVSNLRVNFSEQEAASEAREYTPVPSGKYPCYITDYETKFSTSQKNNGKPYWSLTLTVQDGNQYAGRKFFANVMLFDGALYSLSQLCKALGGEWEKALETGQIPHGDGLVGREVTAVVVKKVDAYKIEQGEWKEGTPKPMKNEVSGFKSIDAGASNVSSGSNSLMP